MGCTLSISPSSFSREPLGSSSLHFPQIELVHVAGGKPCLNPAPQVPQSRAPKGPRGPAAEGCLEKVAHQPLPPSVSLSHQSPAQGSLPGLGHQPLVCEVPQRLVTSCICPSPSGPGPSRPGAAR